jgi:hypothetical protein
MLRDHQKAHLRGCVTCREHVLPRDENSATECLCTDGAHVRFIQQRFKFHDTPKQLRKV